MTLSECKHSLQDFVSVFSNLNDKEILKLMTLNKTTIKIIRKKENKISKKYDSCIISKKLD